MINVNLADFPAVQTAGNIFLGVVLLGWGPLVWWMTRKAQDHRRDPDGR